MNEQQLSILKNFKLPDKSFWNEAAFTTRFGRQIKDRGGFWHKISDFSLGFKPFDAVFALEGLAGAIEFKFTKNASCTPFTMLRGSSPQNPWTQVEGLWGYERNGWKSLIIVYSAKVNRYVVMTFSDKDLHSKVKF